MTPLTAAGARRTLAALALATTVVAVPATASAAPPVATSAAVAANPQLPDGCSWISSSDPWSWWRGYAGICFTAEGTMWFDWNGGYGYVPDGGWF